jgi:hypothetical protein
VKSRVPESTVLPKPLNERPVCWPDDPNTQQKDEQQHECDQNQRDDHSMFLLSIPQRVIGDTPEIPVYSSIPDRYCFHAGKGVISSAINGGYRQCFSLVRLQSFSLLFWY